MGQMIALVSQGGGTRGAFTAGVQDVLMREKITFPYVIGTSAGALNNTDFISGDIGRSKVVTTELVKDKKFLSLHNLIHKGGIFDFHYLCDELPKGKLPFNREQFDSYNGIFVAVATSLETGEAAYFYKGKTKDIWQGVKASASIPLLSEPVKVDGHLYLDGGVSANVPWRKPAEDGADKLVVILTRPLDFRKKLKIDHPIKSAAKAMYHNYPKFLEAYLNAPKAYNKDLEDLNGLVEEGKAFIIGPEVPLDISSTESDPKKLLPVYHKGVEVMEKLLPDLKEYLTHE